MRRLLSALALSLALPLAACDSTSPDEGIDGEYVLQSINGGTLPWLVVEVGADKLEVVSGSILLRKDGSFLDRTTFRVTQNGTTRNEDDIYEGTFLQSATGATLRPVGFEPYMVAIAGNRLTQLLGTAELVYLR